jgi:hypothetical protein
LLRRFAPRNDDGRHVPRNDDPDVIASEPLEERSEAIQRESLPRLDCFAANSPVAAASQ